MEGGAWPANGGPHITYCRPPFFFSFHFHFVLFFSFIFFSKNHNHKLLKQQQYISQESQSHSTTFQHNNHRNTRITNAFYKHHTKSHKDTQGATTHYGSSTSNTEPAAPAPREDLCRRPRTEDHCAPRTRRQGGSCPCTHTGGSSHAPAAGEAHARVSRARVGSPYVWAGRNAEKVKIVQTIDDATLHNLLYA
jgi:hypothetical protein